MEYRTLGRTGLRVSAVALGCEGFMHKRAEEVKADFDFAIRHGINFVDIYSSNPDLRANIGAALEGRRGEFIIQGHLCTVWENDQYLRTRDPQKSADSFERQLRQLRTDYLDVGMIHYVDAEADLRTVFDGPIIRLAQRLKAEGRIRSIGLSSHNPAVARMAVETGLVDVLMFSINPAYDLQPASENVDALWADESYARTLHNVDPERERLYELC
ncbi:MAG TPA: aldo/keto reductase, partial [Alistipes obesi]|nr:aldo/keto reductase [Alistipes communis]